LQAAVGEHHQRGYLLEKDFCWFGAGDEFKRTADLTPDPQSYPLSVNVSEGADNTSKKRRFRKLQSQKTNKKLQHTTFM